MSELLPPGWTMATLPQIAEINPKAIREIEDDATQVNFIPMRAVAPEGGGITAPEVRTFGEVKRGYTSFVSGDVITAKITPCMENGKTTAVPSLAHEACFGSTEFHVIRPELGIPARWIAHFLLQHSTRRAAQRQMTGAVGQMRVPASFLDGLRIPVAPLDEQNRVCDALDELLSDLDSGVETLKSGSVKLERYRASVLKAAVEGDLTAKWRKAYANAETASVLLQRILKERRHKWEQEQLHRFAGQGRKPPANWKTKYREPVAPNTANLPPLPDNWCWATIEQISADIVDCPHSTPVFIGRGRPCVDTTCMKPAGIVLSALRYVSEDSYQKRVSRLVPKEGDIVFAREGTVGTAVIVPPDLNPCLGQRVMLMRCSFGVLPEYLKACLDSAVVRAQYQSRMQGSTVNHLNVADVKTLCIPIPPFAEQSVITELIADQIDWIDRLQSEVPSKLRSVDALRQSLLSSAFNGELVSQNSADEPASELLKRIAAERAARAKKSEEKKPKRTQTRKPAKRRRQLQLA